MLLSTKCVATDILHSGLDEARLYDQSHILSLPGSRQLVERALLGETGPEITRLQDRLYAHFQRRLDAQLRSIRSAELIPVILQTFCVGLFLAGAYIFFGGDSSTVSTLLMALPMLQYELREKVEKFLGHTVIEQLRTSVAGTALQVPIRTFDLAKLEEEYIRSKPFIDPSLYEAVEQTFVLRRNEFYFTRYFRRGDDEHRHIEVAKTALKLPRTRKLVERTPEQIQHFIEQNFSIYANYEHFSQRIQEIIQIFLLNQTRREHARLQVFLHGPPGVGKTRMIDLLAQFLDLPMVRMDLARSSVRIDETHHYNKPSDLAVALANPVCPVTGKITKAYTNMVVVFDEGDRCVSTEVKPSVLKLMDPKSPPFIDSKLGVTLDLREYLFMVSGNGNIDSVIDGKPLQVPPDSDVAPSPPRPVDYALSDRFTVILHFPGFDPKKFPELIKECLQNHVKTFTSPPLAIDDAFMAMSIEDDAGKSVKISDYIARIASQMKSSTSYRTIEHRCMLIYTRATFRHRRSAK